MSSLISPMSFWFLNHRLEDSELVWQLDEMKRKGFKGVFIHPRDGLETPYLSSEWMDKAAVIVTHCKQIGLHAWLYDEDPYPSGAAGGLVSLNRPEFRAGSLFLESMSCSGGEVVFDFPVGRLLKVVAIPMNGGEASPDWLDLTDRTGLVRLGWNSSYIHHWHYYPPYEDSGNPHWRTATARSAYRTTASLPAGEWKLCAIVARDVEASPRGGYTDLLNPEAVRYFLELTHERYAARFGDQFGETIVGMFTDEPKVLGDVAWTEGLPAYFRQLFDYEITDYLPHLFLKLDDSTDQIRHDYRYALGRRFSEAYVQPIASWCKSNLLISTGHLSPEEDPVGQTRWTPYLMSLLKPFDLPGTDLIAGSIGGEDAPLLHLGPKLASSVAHHGSKQGVLVEAFGANSWELSFRDMKRMTDWLFVMGVTDIVMHAQFYSVDGPRKREAPPSLFYQSSLWPLFQPYCETLSELSGALNEGRHHCHLLLYYPQGSFSVYFPDRKRELELLRNRIAGLQHELLVNQWDFDWVDEETLLEMSVENDKWFSDTESYDALLVLGDHVESGVARYCKQMLQQGAEVWLIGTPPRIIRSAGKPENWEAVASIFWTRQVEDHRVVEALESSIAREVTLYAEPLSSDWAAPERVRDMYMLTRMLDSDLRMFLVNARAEWRTVYVSVSAGQVIKEITLAPNGSALLNCGSSGWLQQDDRMARERRAMNLAGLAPTPELAPYVLDLTGYWRIHPLADNVLVLVDWHFTPTDSLAAELPITNWLSRHLGRQPDRAMSPDEHAYCRFFIETVPDDAWLVTELFLLQNAFLIRINGVQLSDKPLRKRRYDTHNYEWNIASLLRKGLNWVHVQFPEGGHLSDPLRLYGHFSVALPYADCSTGLLRETSDPMEQHCLIDWAQLGYPFYSGTMEYVKAVELPDGWLEANAGKIHIVLGGVSDAARCFVNGMDIGVVYAEPYVWDATDYLHKGSNRIVIQVTNSAICAMQGMRKHSGISGSIKLILSNQK